MTEQTLTISQEVQRYIDEHQDLDIFLKHLPSMVYDIFGENEIELIIFNDFEEDWTNLLIDISAYYNIKQLWDLEDELVNEISKRYPSVLRDITISSEELTP